MLAATSSPGSVSQPTLSIGHDFNCTATMCYGIGAVDSTFLTLQAYINKFAKVAGFTPIAVDGKVGDGTALAFQRAAAWILRAAGAGSTMKFGAFNPSDMARTQVAMYALEIIKTFDFWSSATSAVPNAANAAATASAGALPAQLPSVPQAVNLPDLIKASAGGFGPAQAAVAAQVQAANSKPTIPTWAWVVGGVAVVGGGALLVARSRRKAS